MYIKDGICYAGELSKPIEIVSAIPKENQILEVWFSSGEHGLFNAETLTGSVFESLKDSAVFKNVAIEYGTVSWANGSIDVAPEFVYQNTILDEKESCVAEEPAEYNKTQIVAKLNEYN